MTVLFRIVRLRSSRDPFRSSVSFHCFSLQKVAKESRKGEIRQACVVYRDV